MSAYELINSGKATTAQALDLFDSLPVVPVDFMIGHWKGEGFHTDHPLDGVLEAFHWYGKRFESSEHVHPLVFSKRNGGVAYVNPIYMAPSMGRVDKFPIPKSSAVGRLFQWFMPLLSTQRSRARLRMTEYRGKSSATMIYDNLPINDVFRKIDDKTLLGIMDLKGMKAPFFFVLRRES